MAYFCSKCGHELKDKNSCCQNCWTWHGYGSCNRTKAVNICKKCGRELETGTIVCGYCWTPHRR